MTDQQQLEAGVALLNRVMDEAFPTAQEAAAVFYEMARDPRWQEEAERFDRLTRLTVDIPRWRWLPYKWAQRLGLMRKVSIREAVRAEYITVEAALKLISMQ